MIEGFLAGLGGGVLMTTLVTWAWMTRAEARRHAWYWSQMERMEWNRQLDARRRDDDINERGV